MPVKRDHRERPENPEREPTSAQSDCGVAAAYQGSRRMGGEHPVPSSLLHNVDILINQFMLFLLNDFFFSSFTQAK